MSKIARSRMLRVTLLILLISTGIAAGWFIYDRNPNTVFKRFENDVRQENLILYDTILNENYTFPIVHPGELNKKQVLLQQYLARLKKIDLERLNVKNKVLSTQLEQSITKQLRTLHTLQTDPSIYNLGGEMKAMLVSDSIPLDGRLLRIGQLLKDADAYYSTAKANLTQPHPDRTVLAMQKQLRTLNFLNGELLDSLALANLSAPEREELKTKAAQAKLAVKDYLAFCRSLLFEQRDSTLKSGNERVE